MLVYAAIVPHPPFAIESVGKDKIKALDTTIESLKHVGEDLASLDIDTILVISPYGERYEAALGIAFHDPYVASLKEFGDMSTSVSFRPDMRLVDKIQRTVRKSGIRSTMTTNDELDYGSAVPLIMLKEYIGDRRVVVITPPVDSPKDIVSLGDSISEALNDSSSRVAVLCSAELSHRLSELSPGGVHPGAEEFDKKIRGALVDGNSIPLLKVSAKEIEEQGAQGLDAIRLFWGILGDTGHTMEEHSYEHPFGIGHLVMVARLHQ
ncbi:hypothetical protein HOI83_01355 [Candidatus Uhrbacteria bacterium]|jgi:MEMO1 family protein|nr:hypothetical protein [Candidatus Uhrbacteria bacterium]